jgi:hypothetical protein
VLQKKKSRTFNFGKIGYRKSPDAITLPKKGTDEMEALCDRIEEQQTGQKAHVFMEVMIRTQNYVLKSDLSGLEDEDFDAIGVKHAPGNDVFFVQPDREKLAEVENI